MEEELSGLEGEEEGGVQGELLRPGRQTRCGEHQWILDVRNVIRIRIRIRIIDLQDQALDR